ncbi:Nucleoporin [Smittium mucronatum]|uniref:Nucleoporin n=1 Tax=Smittium mucronatum TaxID=133383 RepID=A0A1R0H903_9FUNG|nr:Nucleoporin [Smittium mucronatum]
MAISNKFGYTVIAEDRLLYFFLNRTAQESLNTIPVSLDEDSSQSFPTIQNPTVINLNLEQGSFITHVSLMGSEQNILISTNEGAILLFKSSEIQKILDTSTSKSTILNTRTKPTSICWSRKGKQLAVGSASNSIETYSISGDLKRMIQLPNKELSILSLCWMETYSFLSVSGKIPLNLKKPIDYDHSFSLTIVTQNNKKSALRFLTFDDPCPAWGLTNRGPQRYFCELFNYGADFECLIFISASASTDIATVGKVLSKGSDSDYEWKLLNLPENFRAILPFSKIDESSDTAPLGMAIDLTSKISLPPLRPDESDKPLHPVPILWILNTDGFLLSYNILNTVEADKHIKYSGILDQIPLLNNLSEASSISQDTPSSYPLPNNPIFGSGDFGKSLSITNPLPKNSTPLSNPSFFTKSEFGSSSFMSKMSKDSLVLSSTTPADSTEKIISSDSQNKLTSMNLPSNPSYIKPSFDHKNQQSTISSATQDHSDSSFNSSKITPDESSVLSSSKSSFGGNISKPTFGAPTFSQSSSQPVFGNSSFGQNKNSPVFGSSSFGTSAFGGSASGTSAFGGSVSVVSAFGSSTSGAPSFGGSSSAFGGSSSGVSAFGSSTSGTPSFGSSKFGASAFGGSVSGVSAFGSSTSGTPSFSGSKSGVSFSGSSAFGNSASANPVFGSSAFGKSSSGIPTFGTSAFKDPNSVNSAFGSSSFGPDSSQLKLASSASDQKKPQSAFGKSVSSTFNQESSVIETNLNSEISTVHPEKTLIQTNTKSSSLGNEAIAVETSKSNLGQGFLKPSFVDKKSTQDASSPKIELSSFGKLLASPNDNQSFIKPIENTIESPKSKFLSSNSQKPPSITQIIKDNNMSENQISGSLNSNSFNNPAKPTGSGSKVEFPETKSDSSPNLPQSNPVDIGKLSRENVFTKININDTISENNKDVSKIQVEGLKSTVPRKPASGSYSINLPTFEQGVKNTENKNEEISKKSTLQSASNLALANKNNEESINEERKIRLDTYLIIVKQFQSSCLNIDNEFKGLEIAVKKNKSLLENIGVDFSLVPIHNTDLKPLTTESPDLYFYSDQSIKNNLNLLKLGDRVEWNKIIGTMSITFEEATIRANNLKSHLNSLKNSFCWIEMRKDLFLVLFEKRKSLFFSKNPEFSAELDESYSPFFEYECDNKNKFKKVEHLTNVLESIIGIPSDILHQEFLDSQGGVIKSEILNNVYSQDLSVSFDDFVLNESNVVRTIDSILDIIRKKKNSFKTMIREISFLADSSSGITSKEGLFKKDLPIVTSAQSKVNFAGKPDIFYPSVYGTRSPNVRHLVPITSGKKNRSLSLQSHSKSSTAASNPIVNITPKDSNHSAHRKLDYFSELNSHFSSSDYLKFKKKRSLLMAQMKRSIGKVSVKDIKDYCVSEKNSQTSFISNSLNIPYKSGQSDTRPLFLDIDSLIKSLRTKFSYPNIDFDLESVLESKKNSNILNLSPHANLKHGLFTDGVPVQFNKSKKLKTPKIDVILNSLNNISIGDSSNFIRKLNFDNDPRFTVNREDNNYQSQIDALNLSSDLPDIQKSSKYSSDKYWCCKNCQSFNENSLNVCSACGCLNGSQLKDSTPISVNKQDLVHTAAGNPLNFNHNNTKISSNASPNPISTVSQSTFGISNTKQGPIKDFGYGKPDSRDLNGPPEPSVLFSKESSTITSMAPYKPLITNNKYDNISQIPGNDDSLSISSSNLDLGSKSTMNFNESSTNHSLSNVGDTPFTLINDQGVNKIPPFINNSSPLEPSSFNFGDAFKPEIKSNNNSNISKAKFQTEFSANLFKSGSHNSAFGYKSTSKSDSNTTDNSDEHDLYDFSHSNSSSVISTSESDPEYSDDSLGDHSFSSQNSDFIKSPALDPTSKGVDESSDGYYESDEDDNSHENIDGLSINLHVSPGGIPVHLDSKSTDPEASFHTKPSETILVSNLLEPSENISPIPPSDLFKFNDHKSDFSSITSPSENLNPSLNNSESIISSTLDSKSRLITLETQSINKSSSVSNGDLSTLPDLAVLETTPNDSAQIKVINPRVDERPNTIPVLASIDGIKEIGNDIKKVHLSPKLTHIDPEMTKSSAVSENILCTDASSVQSMIITKNIEDKISSENPSIIGSLVSNQSHPDNHSLKDVSLIGSTSNTSKPHLKSNCHTKDDSGILNANSNKILEFSGSHEDYVFRNYDDDPGIVNASNIEKFPSPPSLEPSTPLIPESQLSFLNLSSTNSLKNPIPSDLDFVKSSSNTSDSISGSKSSLSSPNFCKISDSRLNKIKTDFYLNDDSTSPTPDISNFSDLKSLEIALNGIPNSEISESLDKDSKITIPEQSFPPSITPKFSNSSQPAINNETSGLLSQNIIEEVSKPGLVITPSDDISAPSQIPVDSSLDDSLIGSSICDDAQDSSQFSDFVNLDSQPESLISKLLELEKNENDLCVYSNDEFSQINSNELANDAHNFLNNDKEISNDLESSQSPLITNFQLGDKIDSDSEVDGFLIVGPSLSDSESASSSINTQDSNNPPHICSNLAFLSSNPSEKNMSFNKESSHIPPPSVCVSEIGTDTEILNAIGSNLNLPNSEDMTSDKPNQRQSLPSSVGVSDLIGEASSNSNSGVFNSQLTEDGCFENKSSFSKNKYFIELPKSSPKSSFNLSDSDFNNSLAKPSVLNESSNNPLEDKLSTSISDLKKNLSFIDKDNFDTVNSPTTVYETQKSRNKSRENLSILISHSEKSICPIQNTSNIDNSDPMLNTDVKISSNHIIMSDLKQNTCDEKHTSYDYSESNDKDEISLLTQKTVICKPNLSSDIPPTSRPEEVFEDFSLVGIGSSFKDRPIVSSISVENESNDLPSEEIDNAKNFSSEKFNEKFHNQINATFSENLKYLDTSSIDNLKIDPSLNVAYDKDINHENGSDLHINKPKIFAKTHYQFPDIEPKQIDGLVIEDPSKILPHAKGQTKDTLVSKNSNFGISSDNSISFQSISKSIRPPSKKFMDIMPQKNSDSEVPNPHIVFKPSTFGNQFGVSNTKNPEILSQPLNLNENHLFTSPIIETKFGKNSFNIASNYPSSFSSFPHSHPTFGSGSLENPPNNRAGPSFAQSIPTFGSSGFGSFTLENTKPSTISGKPHQSENNLSGNNLKTIQSQLLDNSDSSSGKLKINDVQPISNSIKPFFNKLEKTSSETNDGAAFSTFVSTGISSPSSNGQLPSNPSDNSFNLFKPKNNVVFGQGSSFGESINSNSFGKPLADPIVFDQNSSKKKIDTEKFSSDTSRIFSKNNEFDTESESDPDLSGTSSSDDLY